jgi:protein transport protein SEC20
MASPILAKFDALASRLRTLHETTASIQDLITRLATIKFPPGAVPLGTPKDTDVIAELSAEIHESIKEQNEDLDELEQDVRDLPGGRKGSDIEAEKLRLLERCSHARVEIKASRSKFRQAQITAQKNLQLSQRAERALLLASLKAPPPSEVQNGTDSGRATPISRRRTPAPESKEDKVVAAASDVTAALRRTHALMASELSRSQFAHDTLQESTKALESLTESYYSLDSILANSRSLVSTLITSQKSDTWYLESAFYILAVTLGWLIFRRFIYGPAWWFIWLPLKLFYNAWMGVFAAIGLRGGNAVAPGVANQSLVSSVMAGVTGAGTVRATMSGTGAPQVAATNSPGAQSGSGGIVEEVGQMVDNTRQQAQGAGQAQPLTDEERAQIEAERALPRNPKKRMYEEKIDKTPEEAKAKKDEL